MHPSCIPVLSLALVLTGCGIDIHHGENSDLPLQTRHQKIARDKSELTRTEVTMGAGELRISGGTSELMEGDFSFRDTAMDPQVRYNNSSFHSVLQVEQRTNTTVKSSGKGDCKWELRLSEEVPMDIVVKMGAGESRLDLGKLDLRSVEVNVGAGQVDLDLRGTPRHDIEVKVRGGVGEATVRVPRSARVTADAKGGIGNVEVHGFEERNGQYENSPDKDAKYRIHLDVKGGIGQIKLVSE